jgi:SAM-dependent methyltransferase
VQATLEGHRVLDLACGTGYWANVLADSADYVLGVDINRDMIAAARERGIEDDLAEFEVADAFNLPDDLGDFTAIFIGFWWSQVRREDQERLLAHLRKQVGKDVLLVLVDEQYVEGSSLTVARTDLEGNTYQIAVAPDGERYELVKNYPSDSALRKKLASNVREIKIGRSDHFWALTCRLK